MKSGAAGGGKVARRYAWFAGLAVVGAFVILGAVWGIALRAAAALDTHRLSREEEKVLLEKREREATLIP